MESWKLSSVQDVATVTPDWDEVDPPAIDGLIVREVRNVLTGNGALTEIFRDDWNFATGSAAQVFARQLDPGGISAWHCHGLTTDHLACIVGRIQIVLFDAREESPTHGAVRSVLLGAQRSRTIEIPPGVWHGVRNLGPVPAILINCVDKAYAYDAPDHWRLPLDTPQIPYRFL